MIERLVGQCAVKQASSIIVDVNGVGYGVEMTEAGLARLSVGDTVTVWVHTYVREDALRLFGFLVHEERQLFHLLLSVSGVGPKLAMGILSGVDARQLIDAVERDDSDLLETVPGIGQRQSKKIILELKPKLAKIAGIVANSPAPPVVGASKANGLSAETLKDLKSALENFGYKEKELLPLLKKLERQAPDQNLQALIRMALAELTGSQTTTTKNQEILF